MNPIRLHYPQCSLVEGMSYIPLLYPFLGVIEKDTNPFVTRAFKEHGFTKEGFELTDDASSCDYVLVPHPYDTYRKKHPELLANILRVAREHGKKILIDGSGDVEFPIDIPEAEILRISSYRFSVRKNEITIPVPVEDFLELYANNTLEVRKKGEKASVGFMGWAHLPFKQWWRAQLKSLPHRFLALFDARHITKIKGVLLRARVIRTLQHATRIIPNFVIRDSYSAHKKTVKGDMETLRREYVENMRDSDYTLSVRGDPNADCRLYETLSLGRIPVLIDTERVLPLAGELDYREFCCVVDFREIGRLEDKIANFHASLTPEQFESMQQRAREVFEKYLRTDSFTPHLARILRERLG